MMDLHLTTKANKGFAAYTKEILRDRMHFCFVTHEVQL
jgi:hypothetical protein